MSAGIASWTEIEAVFGGDGDDQIIGNDLDNEIRGGKGDDIIVLVLVQILSMAGGIDCVVRLRSLQPQATAVVRSQVCFCCRWGGEDAWSHI